MLRPEVFFISREFLGPTAVAEAFVSTFLLLLNFASLGCIFLIHFYLRWNESAGGVETVFPKLCPLLKNELKT